MLSRGTFRRFCLALSLGLVAVAALAADAGAYAIYVGDRLSGILAVNSATGQVVGPRIATGESPIAPVLSADGKVAYVANFNSGSIGVFDTQTRQPIGAPIPAGGQFNDAGPLDMVLSPDGQRLYVAAFYDSTLTAIDLATRTVAFALPLEGATLERPGAIAMTPDGRVCILTNGLLNGELLWAVDTQTQTVERIPVEGTPTEVAITPDGRSAYVVTQGPDRVLVLDLQSRQVTQTIPLGAAPARLVITPDGRTAYVTLPNAGAVAAIDLASNQVTATIPAGSRPGSIVISPDGERLHVVDAAADTVVTIATRTRQVTTSSPTGVEATSLSIGRADLFPTAAFATRKVARLGAPVPFDASPSLDPDGALTSFAWSFGDGRKATVATPTTTHAFTRVGTFTATLTVADEEGCSTTPLIAGRPFPCYGSPLATTSGTLKVVYPGVRVKCPGAAKPTGCKVTLQGFTKKRKGKPETAVAKAEIKAGKSAVIPFKPKGKFITKLGKAKVILVKQTLQVGTAKPKTTFRRLLIRLSGNKKPAKR